MKSNQLLEVEVVQRKRESENVTSLVLARPCRADLPLWDPGAHIDVIHHLGPRQYSLSGDRSQRKFWRISVAHDAGSGVVSNFIAHGLKVGDVLKIGLPRNNFPLVEAASYIFLAGGIGITPMLPMIDTVIAQGRTWKLHYGVRAGSSYAFETELSAYTDNVTVWAGRNIDLGSVIESAPSEAHVYCCGPKSMIDATLSTCARLGITESLHIERFAPAEVKPDSMPDQPFTVVCSSSQLEFEVDANESLLDALIRHGVSVPFSCMSGTCGACDTPVLEGVPIHRDSILTSSERSANDRMLVCVSRCASKRLVLDV